jgi:hypothetical protein
LQDPLLYNFHRFPPQYSPPQMGPASSSTRKGQRRDSLHIIGKHLGRLLELT